jgi:hypothetical protein
VQAAVAIALLAVVVIGAVLESVLLM